MYVDTSVIISPPTRPHNSPLPTILDRFVPLRSMCADSRDPVHGAVARSVRAAVAVLGGQGTHAVGPQPDVVLSSVRAER